VNDGPPKKVVSEIINFLKKEKGNHENLQIFSTGPQILEENKASVSYMGRIEKDLVGLRAENKQNLI
jgi:hypothetical protein